MSAERTPVRRERDFQPGERVRVAAAGHGTHGRLGTVVEPDEAWPFGPCVLLDGDAEPAAFAASEIEPAPVAPSRTSHSPPPSGAQSAVPILAPADDRFARAIAALILEERARTDAAWRAKLDAVQAASAQADAAAADPVLDREALIAVLSCAEEYVSGAPLNRALVLHALRAALVRLGARPGAEPLPDERRSGGRRR